MLFRVLSQHSSWISQRIETKKKKRIKINCYYICWSDFVDCKLNSLCQQQVARGKRSLLQFLTKKDRMGNEKVITLWWLLDVGTRWDICIICKSLETREEQQEERLQSTILKSCINWHVLTLWQVLSFWRNLFSLLPFLLPSLLSSTKLNRFKANQEAIKDFV